MKTSSAIITQFADSRWEDLVRLPSVGLRVKFVVGVDRLRQQSVGMRILDIFPADQVNHRPIKSLPFCSRNFQPSNLPFIIQQHRRLLIFIPLQIFQFISLPSRAYTSLSMYIKPSLALVLGLAALSTALPFLESSKSTRSASRISANGYIDDVSKREIVNDLKYKYGSYADADRKDKRELVNDLKYKYGSYADDKEKRELVNDLKYKYGSYADDKEKRELVNDLKYK